MLHKWMDDHYAENAHFQVKNLPIHLPQHVLKHMTIYQPRHVVDTELINYQYQSIHHNLARQWHHHTLSVTLIMDP